MDFHTDNYNITIGDGADLGVPVAVSEVDMSKGDGWFKCRGDGRTLNVVVNRHPFENKFQVVVTCYDAPKSSLK